MRNYYGDLCTRMYELLHPEAPPEELEFYLSFARPGDNILEALCGSGRFLVPFLDRGFRVSGVDLSGDMLARLRQKAPDARVTQSDILTFAPEERFDYIFISSGSVSLFTDMELCRQVLRRLKDLLLPEGILVFAVDTIANRCPDGTDYQTTSSAKTEDGCDLVLKTKNRFDPATQTQFSPGIYQLYRDGRLLAREEMDFQTHLYRFGELEPYLKEIGFPQVRTYRSFSKELAGGDQCDMFLFACGFDGERV